MNFVEIKTLDGEFRIINLDHIVSIKSICKGNGTCFTDVNGSTYHADVPYRLVADDLCGNDDDGDDSDDDEEHQQLFGKPEMQASFFHRSTVSDQDSKVMPRETAISFAPRTCRSFHAAKKSSSVPL